MLMLKKLDADKFPSLVPEYLTGIELPPEKKKSRMSKQTATPKKAVEIK